MTLPLPPDPDNLQFQPQHLRTISTDMVLWRVRRTSGEHVVPCDRLRYWARRRGGVARAILDYPQGGFACRAVTGNPTSKLARAFADLGAELVQADLDDEDSLTRAFAGAHGAHCMTNFFEHFTGGQGGRPGGQPGPGRQSRRDPACNLVDHAGQPSVGPPRRRSPADAAGQV